MPEFLIPKTRIAPAVLPQGQGRETLTTGPELEGWGQPRWALQLSPRCRGSRHTVCLAAGLGFGLGGTHSGRDRASEHLYVHQQKAAVRPTLPVAMLSSGKFIVTIGAGKLKGVSSTDKHVG